MKQPASIRFTIPEDISRVFDVELRQEYLKVTQSELTVQKLYQEHGDLLDLSLPGFIVEFDFQYREALVMVILGLLKVHPEWFTKLGELIVSQVTKDEQVKIRISRLKEKQYFNEIYELLIALLGSALTIR